MKNMKIIIIGIVCFITGELMGVLVSSLMVAAEDDECAECKMNQDRENKE